MIQLPEAYRETFNAPVFVVVQDSAINGDTRHKTSARTITERLNEIYRDNPAVIDEDILAAQYQLLGEEDW